MQHDKRKQPHANEEAAQPAPARPSEDAPRFERPRVRRLGALPAVTTAFGGSFTP